MLLLFCLLLLFTTACPPPIVGKTCCKMLFFPPLSIFNCFLILWIKRDVIQSSTGLLYFIFLQKPLNGRRNLHSATWTWEFWVQKPKTCIYAHLLTLSIEKGHCRRRCGCSLSVFASFATSAQIQRSSRHQLGCLLCFAVKECAY